MFITLPELEISSASIVDNSSAKCWRGFALTGAEPWFVATLKRETDEGLLMESICLLCEDDLVPLLHIEASYGCLVGLQRMKAGDRIWTLDNVIEVWVGRKTPSGGDDALLYRIADCSNTLVAFDGAVPAVSFYELCLLRSFDCGAML